MKNKIKKNLSEAEIEENDEYLRKLVRILNNKEKYGYKPIFIKSSLIL